MFNMQKMMKQAQEMQMKLQEVQEKLKDIEVSAESGGGLVKVTSNCAGVITKVEIDDSLMASDKETLEDLIIAAMNTVNDVKDAKIKTETQAMMEGLGLPADAAGGMPF
jgi:DNA-binding YbaB/EbfC family protein